LEHGFYDFPYIGNFVIPTDELIFFRGVGWNHQPDCNRPTPAKPSPSTDLAMTWALFSPLKDTQIWPCCFLFPPHIQWIGLGENLQENPIFNGKNHGFL
jgi:hypothetical protein